MSNESQTPVPDINKTLASIGQHLSSSSPRDAIGSTGTRPLKFGNKSSDQWVSREPDLAGAVFAARLAVFGYVHQTANTKAIADAPAFSSETGGYVVQGDENVAPQFFKPQHFRVTHPFWSAFEPSEDVDDDWALLAGHMQRIYTELVTTVIAGGDHRPALLKIIGMEDAVDAVHRAKMATHSRGVPWTYKREYLVMQNWEHAGDGSARTKQIRTFLKNNTTVPCTVKTDPSDENRWTIKPWGQPAIEFHAPDYLAIDRHLGGPVVFEAQEMRRR